MQRGTRAGQADTTVECWIVDSLNGSERERRDLGGVAILCQAYYRYRSPSQ